MSQMEHKIHVTDVEANRYLRSKLRALQVQETSEPERTPEPTHERPGKKIVWGPVLKIEQKEIEQGPV